MSQALLTSKQVSSGELLSLDLICLDGPLMWSERFGVWKPSKRRREPLTGKARNAASIAGRHGLIAFEMAPAARLTPAEGMSPLNPSGAHIEDERKEGPSTLLGFSCRHPRSLSWLSAALERGVRDHLPLSRAAPQITPTALRVWTGRTFPTVIAAVSWCQFLLTWGVRQLVDSLRLAVPQKAATHQLPSSSSSLEDQASVFAIPT